MINRVAMSHDHGRMAKDGAGGSDSLHMHGLLDGGMKRREARSEGAYVRMSPVATTSSKKTFFYTSRLLGQRDLCCMSESDE